MESWENKLLGDKLNSLHEFPAGYSPNLSAKWEIIEASLPDSKKRRAMPLLIHWSVAAAVLLAIGLVWVNTGKMNADNPVAQQNRVKQKAPPSQITTHPADADSFLLSPPSHGTATITKSKKEALAPIPLATILVTEDTTLTRAGTAFTVDSFPTAETPQSVVTILSEEKPRPPKKKIYQRDFNDGILVIDTGFTSSRQHFSVQINPFKRKVADGEIPVSRLQLKQAL